MPFGIDNTDFTVLAGLVLAVLLYVKRNSIKELLMSDDGDITAVSSGNRDIAQVVTENNKNYLVLYASQTGTAEDYAKKFSKELVAKFNLNVMCADVENYDFESLNDVPVIVSIFISTYGEGDFPDGAVNFEDFICNAEAGALSNLRYNMFGLGNSTYEFFNGAAKKAEKHLSAAGATRLGKLGEADDGAGTTDEDYMAWKDSILEVLKDELHLDEQEAKFTSQFQYTVLNEITDSVSLGEPSAHYLPSHQLNRNADGIQLGPFDLSQPFIAPIVKSRELFSSNDRNCIHSEFDLSGSNIKYSTGDHLAVWPSNPLEKVEQFLSIFNLDPETIFDLKPLDPTVKVPFPTPTTIGAAIKHYLEITGPVSRQLFSSLIQFAPNADVKEKLTLLSKDKDQFAVEITSKYFNIADALKYLSDGAKWDTVPMQFLVESVPQMTPRYYSISSSSLSEKQTVHVTSIVENFPNPELPDAPPVVGVTTNLLRNIQLAQNNVNIAETNLPVHYDLNGPRKLFANYKLPVHVRRSNFRLPSNPSTPVIMIGPGTGVAPFRGFIRERVAFLESQKKGGNNVSLGKHILFYGSRNTDDFLYQDEWPEYAKKLDGSFEMVVAHSRLPNTKKVYVQDKLKDYEDQVFEMINNSAFIYVCGDAKGMAKGVSTALVVILSRGKSITTDEATELIKMLKTSGRYQEDVW